MEYKEMIQLVGGGLNIPIEVVDYAYRSYWKYVRDTIKNLPLKEDISEEEFNKLRTNFNVPSLGKLSCTYDRMIGVKKKNDYLKNLKNKK